MTSADENLTVVVNVSGGVVQDVVATKSVRVIVVDYDIDEALVDRLPTIVARSGSMDKAAVCVPIVASDPVYVRNIESTLGL